MLAEIRRAFRAPPTWLDWSVANNYAPPAADWDPREREGKIRRKDDITPYASRTPLVPGHSSHLVGNRVDYRDQKGDLACTDLGDEIIVHHPSTIRGQRAGLRLARAKWGDTSVVVDMPPIPRPGDPPPTDLVGQWRTIDDLYEALARLDEIEREFDERFPKWHEEDEEEEYDRAPPRKPRRDLGPERD